MKVQYQKTSKYFITKGNLTKQMSRKQFEKQTGMKSDEFSDLFTDLFESRGRFN